MIGAVLAVALATPPGMARVKPTHAITGWGYAAESCGQWTAYAAAHHDHGPAGSWVSGYMTRAAVAQNRDLLRQTDFAGAMAWLDNWCAAHPLDPVGNGVMGLETELTHRAISQERGR